jgi:hypothetical protein
MSIRFAKGEKPEIVKENGLEYQAGHLSLIGRNGIPKVTANVKAYLKETFGWDEQNPEDADLTTYGVADTEELKPADLLEWDEDFADHALKAVFDLNPRFLKRPQNVPDTGQAQPETHNEDGTPKSKEETPKN